MRQFVRDQRQRDLGDAEVRQRRLFSALVDHDLRYRAVFPPLAIHRQFPRQ